MSVIAQIRSLLKGLTDASQGKGALFFKTGKGQYAEHDKFIGVTVPNLRKIARSFSGLEFDELQEIIESEINEERFLALIILVAQYQKAKGQDDKSKLYKFYLDHLQYVNNWNLVDTSAHLIMGAHLYDKDKSVLIDLAQSEIMWERRISIVSTWYFIRKHDFEWTFKIAKVLLSDTQDLIHKAAGWMLREVGERDENQLIDFLDQHSQEMPRTMLRYAIEKLSDEQRRSYLTRDSVYKSGKK